jgi:hypothetical protein
MHVLTLIVVNESLPASSELITADHYNHKSGENLFPTRSILFESMPHLPFGESRL